MSPAKGALVPNVPKQQPNYSLGSSSSLHYGSQGFAMCLLHTAKGDIYTHNKLFACATHGKWLMVYKRRQRAPLPCAFVEHMAKSLLCTLGGTQQKKVHGWNGTVTAPLPYILTARHTAKRPCLPCAMSLAHGKMLGTRQISGSP